MAARTRISGPGRRGAGLITAVMALAVAGCGGSSPGAGTPTPPATVAAVRPAPTPTAPALTAGDYVLTAGTVTRGFTAEPAEESKNADGGSITRIAACLGVPTERLTDENSGEADGPDFSRPDNLWVSIGSTAEIVTAETVVNDTAILANPRFASCAAQDFKREFTEGAGGSGITYDVASATMPPPPEGVTGLLRLGMNITSEGRTDSVVFDLAFFFTGRVETSVIYTSPGGPPPAAHWQRIADQISAKLQNQ